jgi:hypothetical protein
MMHRALYGTHNELSNGECSTHHNQTGVNPGRLLAPTGWFCTIQWGHSVPQCQGVAHERIGKDAGEALCWPCKCQRSWIDGGESMIQDAENTVPLCGTQNIG